MKAKLFFGVVAIALFASCESIFTHEIMMEPDDEVPDMTFSAIIENRSGTRTTLSDETNSAGYYSLQWIKGDAINISDGENTAIFTTESDGSSTGEFTLKSGTIDNDAYTYTAFYPSNITSNHMVLPAEQNYLVNDVENFPMYAKSHTKKLEFKNLCGIIRLSLKSEKDKPVEISSINLSAGNAGMSGNFSIGEDGSAIVDGNDGVILICERTVPLYNSIETDFNIIVPQGDYNPLKVKITDVEGKEINLVSEGKIHVSRSGITKITLTLDSSSFDSSLERIPITESDVEFTDR